MKKQDGWLWPWINYQRLNYVMVKYTHPLLFIPATIDRLWGDVIFTTIKLLIQNIFAVDENMSEHDQLVPHTPLVEWNFKDIVLSDSVCKYRCWHERLLRDLLVCLCICSVSLCVILGFLFPANRPTGVRLQRSRLEGGAVTAWLLRRWTSVLSIHSEY